MPLDLARVRTILLEIPRQGKIAYCLFRDPRVPMGPKLALGGVLALIVSPIDFPGWIPVLGDFDMLALGVLAVKVFIEACPEGLVLEHRSALKRGDSLFDQDLGRVRRTVTHIGEGLAGKVGRSLPAPASGLEDETV